MSNQWITVTKTKNKKKKNRVYEKNYMKKSKINKPKLNNTVKEKILQYCEILDDDYQVFHSWKHIYLLGNIKKDNETYRNENKLLVLEYLNKFKIYKNYKKGLEEDFKNIHNKITLTEETLYNEMLNNNLYYNKKLIQEHKLFLDIFNKF